MEDEKVKIKKLFDDARGVERHSEDEETYVGYGVDGYYLSRQDIEHLLNGGVVGFDDGEYGHFLRLKDVK